MGNYIDTIEKNSFRDRAKIYLIRQKKCDSSDITDEELNSFTIDDLTPSERLKWNVELSIDNVVFQTVMTIFTVFALFGDDLRLYICPSYLDDLFYGLACVSLFLFTYELGVSIYIYDNYFNTFFFYLDFLACISVIPDIGWVWNIFNPVYTIEQLSGMSDVTNTSSGENPLQTLGKAGRASRAAARATKVIRIIRMIRLLRFVKLYKQAEIVRMKINKTKNKNKPKTEDDDVEIPEESNISRVLSDSNNKKIISLVLFMVFSLPMLDTGFWATTYLDINYEVTSFVNAYKNYKDVLPYSDLQLYMRQEFKLIRINHGYTKDNPNYNYTYDDNPLAYFKSDPEIMTLLFDDPKYVENDLPWLNQNLSYDMYTIRGNELRYYQSDYNTLAIFIEKNKVSSEAYASIMRTLFVCIVLTSACYLFSSDSETLVLNPIERMINFVKKVIKNPLEINEIKEEIDNFDEDQVLEMTREPEWYDPIIEYLGLGGTKDKKEDLNIKQQFETKILENSIQKLCNLLVVGVGDAGKDIIVNNISKSADIDTLLLGHKMEAIFGYVAIKNFAQVVSILEEEVISYINLFIGNMHRNADNFMGYANKNTGDHFLMIWKLEEPDPVSSTQLAELALMCFIKTLYDTKNNQEIVKYNRTFNLKGDKLYPLKLDLGISIHKGVAIEGAIGSEYKIDPTYISEDILMTKKIESLSSDYKVNLIMSGQFVDILRESTRDHLRLIDRYLISEQYETPLDLYTFDGRFDEDSPIVLEEADFKVLKDDKEYELDTEEQLVNYYNSQHYSPDVLEEAGPFETHFVFRKIVQKGFEYISHESYNEFKKEYKEAFNLFVDGFWKDTQRKLEKCNMIIPDNGTCDFLKNYMDYVSGGVNRKPEKWPGYRTYNDKSNK